MLFLALVEVALAVAGVAPPPRYPPNGTRAGLFDEIRFWVPVAPAGAAPGFARAFPALALEPDPNPRPAFVRDKPPNGFRTFVLGESTVAGYPLGKSFVDWVDVRLRAMLPDRSVEVVNAGNGGWYSAEVAALLHESLDHRPDLLVWAVGHNEVHPANLKNLREERDSSFAAIVKRIAWRLRTTRALARLIPRDARPAAADAADRSIGERPCYGDDLPALQARFRATVEDVVAAARARGVPIVLCTMPRNVRTYAPAASVFSPAVRDDGALRAQWEAAYSDGWAHLQGEASAAGARIALEELRRAAQIDNTPARLHFALGRAHELVGEMADARREFVAALDRDACPNRAQSWTEQATRDVARERNVPLLDIRALFDAAGAHGLTGAELLVDNVHPTFEGHERIAD
ncbi:MAG TPA: SGNH/GDSL hydrolase family protein, partial [Planctomycetota bacterium]|nr:SGNH/GDSL hydrolase family protein [Planctomycetota bacterium]